MSDPGFGIYVHWPYCSAICPYCDFNVYRARGADAAPLIAAIEADLAAHAARFGPRRAQSLFLGGGTPSLLGGGDLAKLIEAAGRAFALDPDCEITLEANPEDAPRFAEQAAAGINRFSIGVQSLDDGALKALGRWHDAGAALDAVEAAAKTGARVSIDLIYAREGQSLAAWRRELAQALDLPVEHVSAYQLTIEPDTAFARKVARGAIVPPGPEMAAALFEATQEECARAGFAAYEISNYARGESARARHNLLYWRSGDWIGVGPGAHGRINHGGVRLALESQRRVSDYIDAVRERGLGWVSETQLTRAEAADEILLMGLRIDEGADLARIDALRDAPINREAQGWLVAQGLVALERGRVRLTAKGRPLANRIAAELTLS
jgi:oxygen-independent coproporphyrinogen-3 oxidase